jgi:Predicted phosphoribosyltransferases
MEERNELIPPKRNPALLHHNLRSAGEALAPHLAHYRDDPNALVLALVRGGVPAALEVSKKLRLKTDVVLVRKLLAPQGPNRPICAATVAGNLVIDTRLPELESRSEPGLKFFLADAIQSLKQRTGLCRGDSPFVNVAGKTILLIDNGARTGATIRAAVNAIRQLRPARIVVAIPMGAPECRSLLEENSDELVCLAWHDPFGHVGMWYSKYDVPQIEQIRGMMEAVAAETSEPDHSTRKRLTVHDPAPHEHG